MIFLIVQNIIKTGQRYTIQIQFNTIQYRSIPFNTVQYRSVPFNTIEDIKGKFVGINGTLNGKKTQRMVHHCKLEVPSSTIEDCNGKFAYTIVIPFNTVQYHSVSTVTVLVLIWYSE